LLIFLRTYALVATLAARFLDAIFMERKFVPVGLG